MLMFEDKIVIKGAKENNLKNVSVEIPKNKLVVFTGVSGSGKSSLAFDTLYAEGQRRYVESLSSYARQFLGIMKKPEVDSITGLSPAISIDQKTTGSNPRSTVGTITEIYSYLRLLYGHIGIPHCPKCGNKIDSQTIQEISNKVLNLVLDGSNNIQIVSPLIKNRKGEFSSLFSKLLSKGFLRVIVDGDMYMLDDIDDIKLEENKKHNIDLVVDRLSFSQYKKNKEEYKKRLTDGIELATNQSDGEIKILLKDKEFFFSENNTCQECGISYPKIVPASFSFNSPEGACPNCSGIGIIKEIDVKAIYNPNLTILEGGIFPWSNRTTSEGSWTLSLLREIAKIHNFNLKTAIGAYPKDIFNLIFFGEDSKETYSIEYRNRFGKKRMYDTNYEGIVNELKRRYKETSSDYSRNEIEKYMVNSLCPTCEGKRLKAYSLAVTINEKNIDDLAKMPIGDLQEFLKNIVLEGYRKEVAHPIVKEILSRLNFLNNVGLQYLTLSRKANTLSGGESQRIRLASQIGTGLTGVLYVLDEPSIGLHARDVSKLLKSLEELRDTGNTVVVVEHDKETMSRSDFILDVGPKAGKHGGKISAKGSFDDIKRSGSLTAKYLNGERQIGEKLKERKNIDSNQSVLLNGIKTHNLKSVDLKLPLNKLIAITGVSGSGKSSMINDTLYPLLMNKIMKGKQVEGEYEDAEGLENINKVIGIDQSPIGRTPRSNPATYTGVFTDIRNIFASTKEAKARGYTASRFSFNVKGGRCEKCRGEGQLKVEMQFLPDMYVDCDLCHGSRYNEEALQIDYKGKNIAEVLNMTVEDAYDFFKTIPPIERRLKTLLDVGLGYIELGQSALELSGGESQRIKLAKELSKMSRGHTVYILDEPTTGLHFYDIDKLLTILVDLVNKGNTVVVVEHNLDIIKFADWIIDLGPEGGEKGGNIVVEGTVEDVINCKDSYTGKYLKKELKN